MASKIFVNLAVKTKKSIDFFTTGFSFNHNLRMNSYLYDYREYFCMLDERFTKKEICNAHKYRVLIAMMLK